jgi:hypothetical protein
MVKPSLSVQVENRGEFMAISIWQIATLRNAAAYFTKFLRFVISKGQYSALRRSVELWQIDYDGPDPEVWHGPLFVHVPKAAGSSILGSGVTNTLGHKTLLFYCGHLPAGVEMPFSFAVVRAPLARFISAFYYLQSGGSNSMDAMWAKRNIPRGMDHNAFAEHMEQHSNVMRWMHFRPQSDFVCLDDGAIGVDRILKLETIQTEWREFALAHGLNPQLSHANAALESSGTRPETNQRCREIIARIYARDFAVLNYPPSD